MIEETDITLDEIFDELERIAPTPTPLRDDEFTAIDFARRYNLTKSGARWRLRHLIERGILESREARDGRGRRVRAYRIKREASER